MISSLSELVEKIHSSWSLAGVDPLDLSSGIGGILCNEDHVLSAQLEALKKGMPCSLPFIAKEKVAWITFGGTQEELLETVEDLRCWLFPYLGWEDPAALVTKQNAHKPQEVAFCNVLDVYFRWYCSLTDFSKVVRRLRMLSTLLDSRPQSQLKIPPSLNALRLDFVASLRTGDWAGANKAIQSIDHWQLDTARNTKLMQIRLLYERREYGAVIDMARSTGLLGCSLPYRITGMLLDAIYQEEIAPVEASQGWSEAVRYYEEAWQTVLAPIVIGHRPFNPDFPLSAYQAYVDRDHGILANLSILPDMPLAVLMYEALPPLTPEPVIHYEVATAELAVGVETEQPSIGKCFWTEVISAVRSGSLERSKVYLENLTEVVLNEPEWISKGAETLLEIFTDPEISADPRASIVAEDVLVEIVDVVLNSSEFPRRQHAVLYGSLVAAWAIARANSNAEHDGRLLLGLVGAAIESNIDSLASCEEAVRGWWNKSKSLRRLSWLLGVLETLVQDHPAPVRLQDLWINGADWLSRNQVSLSNTERSLWRRLGRNVGLEDEFIIQFIGEPRVEEKSAIDELSGLQLRKLAIVSLHERAAKAAAEELHKRTGANVVIVTSTSANELTRTAESADLILFVWAACTHAVYRAFDHVRDKLQYVQGTGPSSIVLAAEQWASLRLCK